ncbi:alpha/beta fold hydrolase [Phenylobacterium sp.]|uniref:alpha/beta fold hydrolase n=1 Tax=Phenylobacterium sp. TaxID=1871053 RepID=UPI0027359356|nr:alpha/beta fold hydrolase [Phenylobacterium sp.]MDP3855097.1 alpha/beta fold hydrolase [Phenylobacterium sp.]
MKPWIAGALGALTVLAGGAAQAADRAVTQGDHLVANFAFKSGETLPALRLHYRTLGQPKRDAAGRVTNAVMVLHGTGGSGAQFLSPQFADELYGAGQPLDISRYYVILPDGIGHGGSSKPSDGLKAAFPDYDYDDMVEAQRRLLVDGLKVDRLRLLMGTSMGCMHGFIWGEIHPDFAQAIMPMACLTGPIAGVNRTWRRAAMDSIRSDPDWRGGDYAAQPALGLRGALNLLIVMGAAPQYWQAQFPSREAADANYAARFAADFPTRDANDLLHQLDASRTYDPSKGLERITAPVTWVNSTDDLINPPDLGLAEPAAKRLKAGKFVLIQATPDTRGHGTHTWAKFWKKDLVDLLARSEPK